MLKRRKSRHRMRLTQRSLWHTGLQVIIYWFTSNMVVSIL